MPIFIINKLILFKLAARALLVSPPVNNDLDFKRTWPRLCYDFKSIYYSPIRFFVNHYFGFVLLDRFLSPSRHLEGSGRNPDKRD